MITPTLASLSRLPLPHKLVWLEVDKLYRENLPEIGEMMCPSIMVSRVSRELRRTIGVEQTTLLFNRLADKCVSTGPSVTTRVFTAPTSFHLDAKERGLWTRMGDLISAATVMIGPTAFEVILTSIAYSLIGVYGVNTVQSMFRGLGDTQREISAMDIN